MAKEVKDKTGQADSSRMVLGSNSRKKKIRLPRSKKGVVILAVVLVLLVVAFVSALYFYSNRSSDSNVDPKDEMSEEMKLLNDYKPQPTEELRYEIR